MIRGRTLEDITIAASADTTENLDFSYLDLLLPVLSGGAPLAWPSVVVLVATLGAEDFLGFGRIAQVARRRVRQQGSVLRGYQQLVRPGKVVDRVTGRWLGLAITVIVVIVVIDAVSSACPFALAPTRRLTGDLGVSTPPKPSARLEE